MTAKPYPVPAEATRGYLNGLVTVEEVAIRLANKDRYCRAVVEISMNNVNIQEHLVEKRFARVYKRSADQCP
ncbi:thermonuclease family protein [Prochlorococcus sp. MIT 1307]|uniref:thermonuclease family protein n=1 Tax=Prochlorococcus sp. MIT 1307 TaxID=3096219 RepID=UPI002A7540F7|nr:thermonuclease family protein [Prochlorococcus sp. MIT 1307]